MPTYNITGYEKCESCGKTETLDSKQIEIKNGRFMHIRKEALLPKDSWFEWFNPMTMESHILCEDCLKKLKQALSECIAQFINTTENPPEAE